MEKNIIIAEKPSVAREYANALGVSDSAHHDGYIENDRWIVTWTVGHLVTMCYPEKYNPALKEWSLETLPFLPENYKYEVISAVKKQFNVVKGLFNRSDIDCIYYAGDSGREGLYIQMLVRQEAGHKSGVREFVVWIDSPTKDEIIRGVSEAKDVSSYENMANSGYMRAIEDYLVGINFSRLLSVKYAAMLNTGSDQKKRKPISVGRVMTCVLGMVVDRERQIRNFREQKFYRVFSGLSAGDSVCELHWRVTEDSKYYNSPKLYSEYGFFESSAADEMIQSLDGKLRFANIDRSRSKKNSPLLFNLAELQGTCSKQFHFSPSKTLQIVQSLYEKKLATYPRTDARVLSSAVTKEIFKNLDGLKKGVYAPFVDKIQSHGWMVKGKYVDDSKITDHYAIIPTGVVPEGLDNHEQMVYDLICRRFLAVFYPAAEFDVFKVEAVSGREHFFGNSKVLVENGFYDVLGLSDKDDEDFIDFSSFFNSGESYDCVFSQKIGKTNPPNRYSTGSLVLAMENAGSLIEDEELREHIIGCGIGTSATRAEVVDKLLKLNYLTVNEKTQILLPTNFGEMVYEVVDCTVPKLLNPEITAEWEKELNDIAVGSLSPDDFKKQLYDFVSDSCNQVKDNDNSDDVFKRIRPLASGRILSEYKEFDSWDTSLKCPLCGKDIETVSWGFKCSGNISKDEGCSFSIGDILGHRLLTPELKNLLSKGKAGPFYDFISSKGKPFGACILWDNEAKKIDLEMVDLPWEKTEYRCPECGKSVMKQGNFFKCVDFVDFDHGCKFFAGRILGKSLPDKQMAFICDHKRTELIKGFKPKDKEKKPFDAFLEWSCEKHRFEFVFPTTDDMRTGYKCPVCGGSILSIHDGYRCENYKPVDKRGDGDCVFYCGKILGHTVKEKELEAIVRGGVTDVIDGFKPKDKEKNPFSARLTWSADKKSIVFVFDENKDVDTGLSCPLCGGKVIKNRFGYFCSENKGKDKGCSFHFSSFLGVTLDDAQFKKLVNTGRTDLIDGFKPKDKNKKPFSSFLVLKDGGISLEFPEYKQNVSEYSCPVCHKKLIQTDYSLKCDCGFHMSTTICEKRLEDDLLKTLFVRGETDVVSGFYSAKRRNYFSAKLKIVGSEVKLAFSEDKKA